MSEIRYKICDKCNSQLRFKPDKYGRKTEDIFFEINIKSIEKDGNIIEKSPMHLCENCYGIFLDFLEARK